MSKKRFINNVRKYFNLEKFKYKKCLLIFFYFTIFFL